MATVTTPAGEKLAGVFGAELDYYRGEVAAGASYVIDENPSTIAEPVFPLVYAGGDDYESAPQPEPVTVDDVLAEALENQPTPEELPDPEGTVEEILAAVRERPDLADAVAEVERRRGDSARKTLLEGLAQISAEQADAQS